MCLRAPEDAPARDGWMDMELQDTEASDKCASCCPRGCAAKHAASQLISLQLQPPSLPLNNKLSQQQQRSLQLVETKTDLLTSSEADERGEINKGQKELWRAGKIEDCQPGSNPLALIYGHNITDTCWQQRCQRVNICLTAPYSS